jgi:NADPH:quinone reductase-like Zn-dependent oxidoreductase
MKAIVKRKSGPPDVLELREVEKPVPGDREVLIKVRAATVTQGDVVLRRLPFLVWIPMRIMLGLRRKKIPGTELAGDVEAVGRAVTRFSPGDQVFGTTDGAGAGSYAEYVCLAEDAALAPMPSSVGYEQAAAVPVGGTTALHFLRSGNIQAGQKVLIYGASGSVGTYAVQLARHFGAKVTGVCSTRNVELVKSLGAGTVVDYTQEDFAEQGKLYDLVFDAVGKTSAAKAEKALAPGGAFVTVQKGLARVNRDDLLLLKELVEVGEIRPVIDRRYPLAQAAEAHEYVEKGHKAGNVVIVVEPDRGV